MLLGYSRPSPDPAPGAGPRSLVVELLDETRELLRGRTDGVDRLHVVHPQRAEEADRSQVAVLEAVGSAHERDPGKLRILELRADAHERSLREQARAHEVEECYTLLEHFEQAPVAGEVVGAKLVEHARRAPHVKLLLAGLERVGEGRPQLREEGPLARRERGILEATAEQARTELQAGHALVQVLARPV